MLRKVIYSPLILLVLFIFACSSSGTSNNNENNSSGGGKNNSGLYVPTFDVEFNSPSSLDFGTSDSASAADNFFSNCIGTFQGQIDQIKQLFPPEEELEDLKKVNDTYWTSSELNIAVEDLGDSVRLTITPKEGGSGSIKLTYKKDHSYAESVYTDGFGNTISMKVNLYDEGKRGDLKYYGGEFETLAGEFQYSTSDTWVTGVLKLIQNDKVTDQLSLGENNQSDPPNGECTEYGLINDEMKLMGRVTWHNSHGSYDVFIYDDAGAHEYKGTF